MTLATYIIIGLMIYFFLHSIIDNNPTMIINRQIVHAKKKKQVHLIYLLSQLNFFT